jgi:hypothetical protein
VNRGDLVRIGKYSKSMGIVIYKHPTKGVVQVYWSDVGFNWESCGRLEIISEFDTTALRDSLSEKGDLIILH